MDSLVRDLKLSLRLLGRTPGFSLAAILLLALGIGLNAGMFSVLNAVVFSPRPFADPERVVQLYSASTKPPGGYRAFSYPVYREIAARGELFEGVLAQNFSLVGVGEGRETRRSFSAIVSSNYFGVLGVAPWRGRAFTPEEGRPGSDIPVTVVSHAFWKRQGSDPGLIGRTIRVNQRQFTVVGIAPEGFSGTTMLLGPELYFPLGVFESLDHGVLGTARRTLARADQYNLFLVARLRQDVAPESAATATRLLGAGLAQSIPEQRDQALEIGAVPRIGSSLSPSSGGPLQTLSVLLLGLTSCVLLVVCLNLASLLLARGQARRKELAIRRALGGGRARIVRQLVTEGLVLAGAGGLLGVLLAAWSTDLLVGTVQTLLPVTLFFEPASPAVFVATTGFCILATFFFALGPALRLSRGDLVRDLGRSAGEDPRESGRSRFLPRHPLVAAQLGLSLGLLIAAGLFVRFVGQAASVHDAFDAEDTLIVEVDGGFAGYDETRGLDSYRRVLERLAALPGVKSAGIAAVAPYGLTDVSKEVQRAGLDTKQPRAFAQWNAVGADYFAALGLPLRRGRAFTTVEAGWSGAPRVAIVDEALARKLWPEGDALGQRIRIARTAEVEIVGIAAASRGAFEKEPRGGVFVPFAQGFTSNAYFHVRPQVQGEASVQALVEPVRRALQAAAPGLPVLEVRSFRQHMRASAGLWALRTSALLFSVFGVLTMLVALVGVYGVQAYAVSRRTREIGIRIALGARPAEVRGLILREGLATALAGVALGLCVGAAVGRLQAAVIVDVRAFDPLAFGMAAALLLGAAALASFLPARRATRIEPLVALRSE